MAEMDMPQAAPRKRRPLSEENGQNTLNVCSPQKKVSPKRQCVRDSEQEVHSDTPAIKGVRSRLQELAEERTEWNGTNNVTEEKVFAHLNFETEDEQSPVPQTRRGRLAKLAQHINNWEDDLSHHTVKKEEPTKKIWQPPKPVESTIKLSSSAKPIVQKAISPAKPIQKVDSPVKLAVKAIQKKNSPAKPASHSTVSPAKPDTTKIFIAKAQLEVNSPQRFISPQKNTVLNPLPKPARLATVTVEKKNTKPKEDEPTEKPILSRMAAWETKTIAAEKDAVEHYQTLTKRSRTKSGPATEKWNDKMSAASNLLTGGKSGAREKGDQEDKAQEVWQEAPVASRKSVWEEKIKKSEQDAEDHHRTLYGNKSVGRLPAQDDTPEPPPPPPKSPGPQRRQASQMQQALKMLQTKANDKDMNTAAKLKAEREAELEALKNRYKNGILRDDTSSQESTTETETESEAEVQPVAPPRGEHSRKRVKEELSMRAKSDTDQDTKMDGEFETKLTDMGFELQSTADLQGKRGHIASISLKEYRQQADGKNVHFEDSFYSPGGDHSLKVFEPADARTSSRISQTKLQAMSPARTSQSRLMSSRTSHSRLPQVESSSSITSTESESTDTADEMYREQVKREVSRISLRSGYSASSTESDTSACDQTENNITVDESAVCHEIDNLLDEAMSDSDEEPPAKKPSPQRRPVMTSASSQDSLSSEEEKPMIYSIDMYRSTSNTAQTLNRFKSNKSAPKITIVRHAHHSHQSSSDSADDELPFIPEKDAKEKIRELLQLVTQEQNVIMQTSNALNQCCMGNSSFAGSAEQVECNKLLLIACQKRQAYLAEIEKLKNPRKFKTENGNLARGSLTISDIRLPIKKEFMSRIGTRGDTTVHYFVLLLRNGPQVIVTQMLSTHDPGFRGSLDFPNLIKLSDISSDFNLVLEVYNMSITKELPDTPKKKDKKFTPKKLLKGSSRMSAYQSLGGPSAVRTTNFSHITSVNLTMKSLNKTTFNLERVPFMCPLQCIIHLRLRCLMEVNIEERGFLNMFEDVSGFGAWHRRWFALSKNKLCYWKYPDEEKNREPMGYIDLKRCVTENVGLIPRDICARPNTFELLTVKPPAAGDRNTLVSNVSRQMTQIRHMLSADTREDRVVWCSRLNDALKNLRSWYSDAMHPLGYRAEAV